MKRSTYFSAAALSLLLGSAIYILFRSESLLMFRWANTFRVLPLFNSLRSYSHGIKPFIPAWAIYSLPFALWMISYMLLVHAIWFEQKSMARGLWLWVVPVVSLAAELGQYPRFVPGTFDVFDLFTIIVATVLAFTIITFDVSQFRKEPS